MTTEEAAVAGLYISGLSVLVTIVAAVLVILQLHASKQVAKTQTAYATIFSGQGRELNLVYERAFRSAFPDVSLEDQLSSETVSALLDNEDVHDALASYMNHYEAIALAVRLGGMEDEYLKKYRSTKTRRLLWTHWRYVLAIREKKLDPNIFIELEGLARQWDAVANNVKFFDSQGKVITGRAYKDLGGHGRLMLKKSMSKGTHGD